MFAETLQDARIRIITEQGFMPVDVIGNTIWSDSSIRSLPLTRHGLPVTKVYCAFYKKEKQDPSISEFATILKSCF